MTRFFILCIFFFLSSGLPLYAQLALSSDEIQEMIRQMSQGRIEADYSSLYYEELGKGDPVILIHDHALSRCMWEEQFYPLSRKYRVIRYDLRGYGDSSSQIEYIQFTHAEDLITLMNALNVEKAHIIGVGMGGTIATDMLAWHPERISSAILINGNIRKIPGPGQLMDVEEAARRDREMAGLTESSKDSIRRERLNELMDTAGSRREDIHEPISKMIEEWNVWQPFHKEARILGGLDTYEIIKEKMPAIPVLILAGQTAVDGPPERPEILDYLPNNTYITLDDCGHLLNMEQPEIFNKTVLDFLQESMRKRKSKSGKKKK